MTSNADLTGHFHHVCGMTMRNHVLLHIDNGHHHINKNIIETAIYITYTYMAVYIYQQPYTYVLYMCIHMELYIYIYYVFLLLRTARLRR